MSRTGIALAVKKGAPHPDVSTPDALKRALLAAKSIGHTAPAGGGITALHIQRVFERLGIAEQVTPKVKLAAGGPNGRVSVLVASGEAEIGLQQVSELMSNPDVEVIGMLPDELQQITINSAGITAIAKEPDAARALIKHLTTPEALAIYKTKGLGFDAHPRSTRFTLPSRSPANDASDRGADRLSSAHTKASRCRDAPRAMTVVSAVAIERPLAHHLNAPFFSSACHFAMSLLRCAASFSGEPPMKR